MIVDGIELLRMIKDGELEEGKQIVDIYNNNYIYQLDEYESLVLKEYDNITKTFEIPDYTMFTDKENKFEIKEKEIDIQAIEEISEHSSSSSRRDKINELIKAIKQLDKKLEN